MIARFLGLPYRPSFCSPCLSTILGLNFPCKICSAIASLSSRLSQLGNQVEEIPFLTPIFQLHSLLLLSETLNQCAQKMSSLERLKIVLESSPIGWIDLQQDLARSNVSRNGNINFTPLSFSKYSLRSLLRLLTILSMWSWNWSWSLCTKLKGLWLLLASLVCN